MPNGMYEKIQMTPVQCNAVIENKLSNLMPLVTCTLDTMEHVNDTLENGGVDWRRMLKRAMMRADS